MYDGYLSYHKHFKMAMFISLKIGRVLNENIIYNLFITFNHLKIMGSNFDIFKVPIPLWYKTSKIKICRKLT